MQLPRKAQILLCSSGLWLDKRLPSSSLYYFVHWHYQYNLQQETKQ